MDVVRTGEYVLARPAGWSDRTTTALLAPPTPGGFVPNLVVTREPLCESMGLGGFAEGHANLIREHATSFVVVSSEEARLGGERALLRLVRWQVAEHEPVLQLQAFCVRDGQGYALIGTAAERDFAKAEPSFRAALEAFRFRDPDAEAPLDGGGLR
jgi:hypothetical protein